MFKDVIHFSGFLKVTFLYIHKHVYIWFIVPPSQFSFLKSFEIKEKRINSKYLKVRETVGIGCFLTKYLYTHTHLCYKHTCIYNRTLPVLV